MRVVVCGGSDYRDQAAVWITLSEIHFRTPISLLMHGGASDTDTSAATWGASHGVPVEEFQADWKKYGLSAASRRDLAMLEYGKPDLVVVFAGGRSVNMIDLARRARIAVKIVS